MPAQTTETLGRFASNAIHHLIATDPAFQLDLELYLCDLLICPSYHPKERTLSLVQSIMQRFALCCGHKDGVPPQRQSTNAYKTIKEERADDAVAAAQTKVFLKVKKEVVEILGMAGSLTEETERIVTKNLIEAMAKDGNYLDKVNDVVTTDYDVVTTDYDPDDPDDDVKRQSVYDDVKRLATEDNGEGGDSEDDSSEDDSENDSKNKDNEDKPMTMEKTLALILEKQNQLLEEKEELKLLIKENEPFDEEAKYKLDTVEFTRLLERKEKLFQNLTNRLEKQDKLVEELMNPVSKQDMMVEDLTNRLEEQDEPVDQFNRLKGQDKLVEDLTNRLKEQDILLKDAVFAEQ